MMNDKKMIYDMWNQLTCPISGVKNQKKNKNASKKKIPISIKIKIDLHQKKYSPGLLWNCPRFQRGTRIKNKIKSASKKK